MSNIQSPIIFIIEGTPVPKQSFRYKKSGSYIHPRIKAWQDIVGWKAREAMQGKIRLDGPVAVRLVFTLNHRRKVDLDNLSKAVLDAMNGIVYEDDNQVVNLHIVKHVIPKAQPGVYIEVHAGGILPFVEIEA